MNALLIFSVALLARTILGYIFYGSIDVGAFISINSHTFNGTLVQHPFTIWCAFPTIPFYLWLSGLLAIKTQLPIAFCFKAIPILFDSLLAVLVYDFVQKVSPQRALQSGLLYALCPVALMITCIHGQWDALPILFFLLSLFVRDFYPDSFKKYFLYGALFAFSFLLKPISLIFILFFFIPWPTLKQTLGNWWTYLWVVIGLKLALMIGFFVFFKFNKAYSIDTFVAWVFSLLSPLVLTTLALLFLLSIVMILVIKPWQQFPVSFQKYLGYQLAAIIGLCAMTGFCFLLLGLFGFNLIRVIDKVLRYCNQGIAVFGLPFAYPFNEGVLNVVLKNRFWIMGIIGLIAVQYYRSKLTVYQGVLASLMVIFSFSGLSPQYLVWAVPLLLIIGLYRTAAIFNLLCTSFFILYYMNPYSNPEVLYQSMLSFAPLKSFSWLLPPAFLTDHSLLWLVHRLGNYSIPAFCFGIAMAILFGPRKKRPSNRVIVQSVGRQVYVLVALALTAIIAGLMLVVDQTNFAVQFKNAIDQKMTWYDTHLVDGFLSGRYGSFHVFNIVSILMVLTLVWCFYAWRLERSEPNA